MTNRIQKAINKQNYDQLVLAKKLKKLSIKLRDFIYEKFVTSETYASLAGGILRAEFGLDDQEVANLRYVIRELVGEVFPIIYNNGTILINMSEKNIDFNTIGVYISESKRGSFVIHWLKWLMTEGINDVVPEYSIWLKPGAGRSEMAFMFKPKDGGSYSVDEQFSGTGPDNWVTRIFRDNIQNILDMISKTMNNKTK